MAQFDLYWNAAGASWLIDVQHGLLDNLSTRIVVPLIPVADAPHQIRRLNPALEIDGNLHVLMTDLMSAVPAAILGAPVASLASERDAIIAALDLAFAGI